jgi:uncharacterized membrane protein
MTVMLLRGLGVGALVVSWALLAHDGAAGAGTDLAVAIALAPLGAALAILAWRAGSRLILAGGVLTGAVLLAAIWPSLRQNVALLYYVEHAGTNLAFAALFGRSLFGGRDALVSHFARLAHDGQISVLKERYTRRVTVAWTLFFLLNVVTSTLLFALATPAFWSIYANLLTMPLIIAMFVAEHAVRICVLPPEECSSVADTFRGYRAAMVQRQATLTERS